MNKTEKQAFIWLEEQGYKNIVFHRHSTPDFTTGTKVFEVKTLAGKSIVFSSGQFERLAQYKDATILVFNHNPEPIASIPFAIIKNGALNWNGINIIQSQPEDNITTLRIKKKTLERLHRHAKYGDSMDDIVNKALDDSDKLHLPKARNVKGQFVKKE